MLAFVTRFRIVFFAIGTIYGFGKKACQSGFASAAWTSQEISLTDAAEPERVGESGDDMFLSDNFGESLRTILAV